MGIRGLGFRTAILAFNIFSGVALWLLCRIVGFHPFREVWWIAGSFSGIRDEIRYQLESSPEDLGACGKQTPLEQQKDFV